MLDNQLYLLLIDGMHLKGVRLYQDEYYFDETYQGETITKTVIIQELQTSIAQGKATPAIENYGFGAKRFYDTANNLGVNIPDDLLYNAQSPDCYHDSDNPLTPIVKELQPEKGQVKRPNTKAQNNYGKVTTALLVIADLDNNEPYNYNAGSTSSIMTSYRY